MTKKPRLLLLEDDIFHRALLAEGLETYYEFEVQRAESLVAAEQALEKARPDALVLDLVLGDDRFGVIRWVQRLREDDRFKGIPILFVTAYYKEFQKHVQVLENMAVLEKPFNFEQVTQKIRGLLGTS